MELGLERKVVAITGGSEGIGRATAWRFAEEGAKLALCARREDVLKGTADAIRGKTGAQILEIIADAAKPGDMERFIEETVKRHGRIDVVVNNAGGSGQSAFETVADEALQRDLDIKLFAQVRTARAAAPHMKKQGAGRIINLNMVGARAPGAAQYPTVVSRAAGLALTKMLSREYAADNILVNAVAVGYIKSMQQERRAARGGLSAEEHYEQLARAVPMARIGEAEEVANVIAFLASDAASYITGSCVNVDGGRCAVL